jgi:hypothetical protein
MMYEAFICFSSSVPKRNKLFLVLLVVSIIQSGDLRYENKEAWLQKNASEDIYQGVWLLGYTRITK